jgi:hypothetical protein
MNTPSIQTQIDYKIWKTLSVEVGESLWKPISRSSTMSYSDYRRKSKGDLIDEFFKTTVLDIIKAYEFTRQS